jgi:hypothetical protein
MELNRINLGGLCDQLSKKEKVILFCYGLGNFYSDREDYVHSLEYNYQSIKIDDNFEYDGKCPICFEESLEWEIGG